MFLLVCMQHVTLFFSAKKMFLCSQTALFMLQRVKPCTLCAHTPINVLHLFLYICMLNLNCVTDSVVMFFLGHVNYVYAADDSATRWKEILHKKMNSKCRNHRALFKKEGQRRVGLHFRQTFIGSSCLYDYSTLGIVQRKR